VSVHQIAANDALVSAQMNEILRRRAESLAQVQEEAAPEETVGLLMFRLGEEWYAVSIDAVREVYNEYTVTRIPCVPDFVLGVINVRGEIVSVTDLGTLIRVPSRSELDIEHELPSAIIVSTGRCVSAIVVDEIGDIVDVSAGALEPPLSTLDKAQAEYMSGSVYVGGLLVGIVNVEKILEPIGESRDGRAS